MKSKKLSLVEMFRKLLDESTDHYYRIYRTLFDLKTDESLRHELEFYHDESKKDDEWFFYFHKGIRQADYFENCTIERTYPLITDKEEKRFREIRRKIIDNKVPYNKRKEDNSGFTDEYSEYLDIYQRRRRQKVNDNIGGNLDSILWNMIHIDEDRLFKLLKKTFFEFENQ
jgi:hypothetical protein